MLADKQLMSAAATSPSTDAESAVQLRMAIMRLARRLRPTAAGAGAGLSPTRVTVLLDIDRRGPIRLSEVAADDGLNPTMVSRVISDLVMDGLLDRSADPGDRRAAWVRVTRAGGRLAERIRRERTDAINAALAELAAGEQQAILGALPALLALADQLGAQR
jgi:DNA-binding MarR family transcriptional regulator